MPGRRTESKMDLSKSEKRLISALESGLEAVECPFESLAARVGLGRDEVIALLIDLRRRGVLRRISAILSAGAAGKPAAALVAWRVSRERLCDAGRSLAREDSVSHCIARKSSARWPYNLYTMMHGADMAAIREKAAAASRELGVEDYIIMETIEELKKTPPVYDFVALDAEDS